MRNMRVKKIAKYKAIPQDGIQRGKRNLRTSSFSTEKERKYFAWGKVVKAYSESMDVDVLIDTGITLKHVRVASKEWTGSNAATGFGERDLPPENAAVLVVFPYGTMDDALVLCSAFSLFGIHTTKWKSELIVANKEHERLRVTENADKETYNKNTGAYKLEINGAEIEITSTGAVNIKAAVGQTLSINGGSQGINNLPTCIVTGAPTCVGATALLTKIPGALE